MRSVETRSDALPRGEGWEALVAEDRKSVV